MYPGKDAVQNIALEIGSARSDEQGIKGKQRDHPFRGILSKHGNKQPEAHGDTQRIPQRLLRPADFAGADILCAKRRYRR